MLPRILSHIQFFRLTPLLGGSIRMLTSYVRIAYKESDNGFFMNLETQ
jgi:hypothetical protein